MTVTAEAILVTLPLQCKFIKRGTDFVWVGPFLTDKIGPSRTVFVNKNGP